MIRSRCSKIFAATILLSPCPPFHQALALPSTARSRSGSFSHEQYAQNLRTWRTAFAASPDMLEPFGISSNDFIGVVANIADFEPKSEMTPSEIQDEMRNYVRKLVHIVSEVAKPDSSVDWGKLDRLKADLEQIRRFAARIVPDETTILNHAMDLATEKKRVELSRLNGLIKQADTWIPPTSKNIPEIVAKDVSPTQTKPRLKRLPNRTKTNNALPRTSAGVELVLAAQPASAENPPPQADAESAFDRLVDFAESSDVPPRYGTTNVEHARYSRWLDLVNKPPNDWPEKLKNNDRPGAVKLRGWLLAEQQKRAARPPRPPSQKYAKPPHERLFDYAESNDAPPKYGTTREEHTLYAHWIDFVNRSPSDWPKELRESNRPGAVKSREWLLAEQRKRVTKLPRKSRLAQLLAHFEDEDAPPKSVKGKHSLYNYWIHLIMLDPKDWPEGLRNNNNAAARRLRARLLAEQQRRAAEPPNPPNKPPLERLLDYVEADDALPPNGPAKDDHTLYAYRDRLVKKPQSQWPKELLDNNTPVAQRLRQLLLVEQQKRASKPPRQKYATSPFERLFDYAEANDAPPGNGTTNEEHALYAYWNRLARKSPSDWSRKLRESNRPGAVKLREWLLAALQKQADRRARQ